MDCVGASDNGDASEETVLLSDYERLSQSVSIPHDPASKDPPPPQTPAKWEETFPPWTPQQKPAAWRLIEFVRSRHRAAGDYKSSKGEKESEDGNKVKKRSSWMPDPDRRWPVQGFY